MGGFGSPNRNPLYTGYVRWNVSEFVRDPDSGKYKRRRRSETEWVSHHDESLRIVSDEVFQSVQMRMRQLANNDKRLKSGGKAKYLLSGLMYCEACGANYVMGDRDKYACSSYIHGRACSTVCVFDGIRRRLSSFMKYESNCVIQTGLP